MDIIKIEAEIYPLHSRLTITTYSGVQSWKMVFVWVVGAKVLIFTLLFYGFGFLSNFLQWRFLDQNSLFVLHSVVTLRPSFQDLAASTLATIPESMLSPTGCYATCIEMQQCWIEPLPTEEEETTEKNVFEDETAAAQLKTVTSPWDLELACLRFFYEWLKNAFHPLL